MIILQRSSLAELHSDLMNQDTQFKLEAGGMRVACLHGELSKMQRQKILAQFIDGRFRALVSPSGWLHETTGCAAAPDCVADSWPTHPGHGRDHPMRLRTSSQIVSDMAARGLDVVDCDAVFNLELPSDAAGYAHRAGRTARAGR
jgi:superfamily II DNA/RNA helicase